MEKTEKKVRDAHAALLAATASHKMNGSPREGYHFDKLRAASQKFEAVKDEARKVGYRISIQQSLDGDSLVDSLVVDGGPEPEPEAGDPAPEAKVTADEDPVGEPEEPALKADDQD